jgi:hypothetical protein
MKICCGICSYNNLSGLKDALASAAPKVDRTVVVNTPYLGFPVSDPQEGLYSKEDLSQYPNTVLIHLDNPVTQIEARNVYMRESKGFGLLLVMDDDERIVIWDRERLEQWYSDIVKKFLDTPTMFNVWLWPKIESEMPFDMPGRLFYLPERIRYLGNHYNFTIDGNHVGRSSKYSLDGRAITIRHLDPNTAGRTDNFEKQMEQYEIWQTLGGEKHGQEWG